MKKIITLFSFLFIINSNAQIGGGWDWVFNTGSLSSASIRHMQYTPDGSQILFGGSALAAAYFGTTTLTVPAQYGSAGIIKFFGKINSATGVPTIIRSFNNLPINFDCITTDAAGNFFIGGAISDVNAVDLGNGVSVSGFNHSVIAKFDAAGNAIWAKTFPFGASGVAQTSILKLAVAPSGNVFLWGFNPNVDANNKRNSPLYKLDSNGSTLWFKDALNGTSTVGNVLKEYSLKDKFIDNNENVHLFVRTSGAYTFDGITYPGYTATSNLISLNSSGTVYNAKSFNGSATNFQVNKTTGNLLFYWSQSVANATPFTNVPLQAGLAGTSFANSFSGMVETDSNFNFIRARNLSSVVENPFTVKQDDIILALPNGKLIVQLAFEKSGTYAAGTDYGYPTDASKIAVAIVETDSDWNIAKFITGGKTTLLTKEYLAAYNDTYAMVAGFSNYDVFNSSAPATLPTTSYGTVNLTGFNAAPDLTTAYGLYSTTASLRADVAFVQTKSVNFPTIASTTWLGTTTNWNDAANWSNGVPTNAMKALFNVQTTNSPSVSTTPTAASLQINAGVNLTLPTTLALVGALKNDGNITINNAGFFQGLGATEWKGSGSVKFTGSAVSFFYSKVFSNSLVLNTDVNSYYDLNIPTITFTTGKLNLGNKKLSITNPNPTAISGTNTTSYIYGGVVERSINTTGNYEFPMGDASLSQTATINTNNLVGVNKLSATYVNGALTGTVPNTSLNGVAITSALNGGWFRITPNQQPTAGTYDVTLTIQNSSNTSATVGNYTIIKRDNATSAWAALGNYNLGSVSGNIVNVKNTNLSSFSDFAIGRGASDMSLGNESFIKKSISLYPNPVSSQINLSFADNLEKANIKVISILGQTVLEKQNISGNNLSLDVSGLPMGTYIIQVKDSNLMSTSRFIKQ